MPTLTMGALSWTRVTLLMMFVAPLAVHAAQYSSTPSTDLLCPPTPGVDPEPWTSSRKACEIVCSANENCGAYIFGSFEKANCTRCCALKALPLTNCIELEVTGVTTYYKIVYDATRGNLQDGEGSEDPPPVVAFSFVTAQSPEEVVKDSTFLSDVLAAENNAPAVDSLWATYKSAYRKFYETEDDEAVRLENYMRNLQAVSEFNTNTSNSFWIGISELSDQTFEEVKAKLLMSDLPPREPEGPQNRKLLGDEGRIPVEYLDEQPVFTGRSLKGTTCRSPQPCADPVDWRNKDGRNYVTPVRNQDPCGSCWAFAATAAIESAYLIGGFGSDLDLSEQQLVSCRWGGSCRGGYTSDAIDSVYRNGQTLESEWPYAGKDGNCREKDWQNSPTVKLSASHYKATGSLGALLAAVQRQPVAMSFWVENEFFSQYRGGVYRDNRCRNDLTNHAMLVVGFDYDSDGKGYWIVKNSWGLGFGEKGYLMVEMHADLPGMCGMYKWGFTAPQLDANNRGFDKTIDVQPDFYAMRTQWGCLEIPQNSGDMGVTVQQNACDGSDEQKFTLEDTGNYWYRIKTSNGLCLAIGGSSTDDGAALIQWECLDDIDDQKFGLFRNGDGSSSIKPKHSYKCLDVPWGNPGVVDMQQWTCFGNANQAIGFEKTAK